MTLLTKLLEEAFIATIDVDSLYTNIDNTNGLEAVKQIFNKNPAQRCRIKKF